MQHAAVRGRADDRRALKQPCRTITCLCTKQADLPEGKQRLPIKAIDVNQSPIVIRNLKVLGDSAKRGQLNLPQALAPAEHAKALGHQLDALWPQVDSRPESTATPPPP